VEAAIQRVIIFRLALGAHLEVAHGGFGAVIGHILNYGKAWATIGAVGEGITVAAVFRIQQLTQTRLTRSDIRRDKLVFPFLCPARPNFKVVMTPGWVILSSYVLDVSKRWGFGLELTLELLNSLSCTFYFNLDIFRSVVHPALKVVLNGQPVDERTEADTLDDAPNANRY